MHVTYHLRLQPDQHAAAERAYHVHAENSPVYRTIHACVDITTSLELDDITSA
jgi:uncharacterized OsmC-like protein